MDIVDSTDRILKENKKIFNSWFEAWLISHVPKLMEQPKWFSTDRDIKICDVVLFLKHEGSMNNCYQYGMINEIVATRDGLIRKVVVIYRYNYENVDRFTTRAVRDLVLIHPVDEFNLMEELGKVASINDWNLRTKKHIDNC